MNNFKIICNVKFAINFKGAFKHAIPCLNILVDNFIQTSFVKYNFLVIEIKIKNYQEHEKI